MIKTVKLDDNTLEVYRDDVRLGTFVTGFDDTYYFSPTENRVFVSQNLEDIAKKLNEINK